MEIVNSVFVCKKCGAVETIAASHFIYAIQSKGCGKEKDPHRWGKAKFVNDDRLLKAIRGLEKRLEPIGREFADKVIAGMRKGLEGAKGKKRENLLKAISAVEERTKEVSEEKKKKSESIIGGLKKRIQWNQHLKFCLENQGKGEMMK